MSAITAQLGNITLSMWASCLMAIVAAIYIVVRCVRSGDRLLLLLAVFGALLGWVVAILATPLSEGEGQRFGELAKVISGFVTGYLLSKLDPLVGALFSVGNDGRAVIADPNVAERVLITLISSFIALLFVFGGRLYWSPGT
ncbi:MAG: hypothetical protein ABI422_02655 [Sphingomicrobium sp.]